MRSLALGLRLVLITAVAIAALSALVGFLVSHFGRFGDASSGIGWGMCLGGALIGLTVGRSGSPSRMAAEGRWSAFGHYWGESSSLPESPLWVLSGALLVFAGGIALIILVH